MIGHVDGETMAEFREGLLPARRAARIAAHLASCPHCAEVDAQLAEVTAILARTPAPPMPASLAARLDAALAAEVAGAAGAGSPGRAGPADAAAPPGRSAPPGDRARHGAGTGPGHTGPGRPAGRRRAAPRLSLRLATVAAAVVVLAGGGYAVTRLVSPGNTGMPASSSGALGSPSGAGGQSAANMAPKAAGRAPGEAGLPVVASGTIYRAGQLPAQVSAVLKRHPVPGQTQAPNPVTAPKGSLAAFPHLAVCVSHLAGNRQPRLVDIARYGSRPAAVVVVPAAGTATVRVWVVGPGCSARGGEVMAQFSMPAPG